MSWSSQPEQLWQPATFLERGVAVPFTTPVLMGTRARPTKRGVELVIPNPSGGRGVYIMGWSDIAQFCTPTLHDTLLCKFIGNLVTITPREIRRAAREVAAAGAAGRAARSAAEAAVQADAQTRLVANFNLLQMLVEQAYGAVPPAAELDRQAKSAILALAARLGRPAPVITNDIEALADIFGVIGFGTNAAAARCTRVLAAMQRMHVELRQVLENLPASTATAASLVMSSCDATLQLGQRIVAAARARLQDLTALLVAWGKDASVVAAEVTRPEWLLDGWEQICLLWQLAPADGRRAAISEMALMVPAIPHEANEWWASTVDEAELRRLRRMVLGFEDWRTGSLVFDLIARNERIRAMAA
jgi:hypothetical protein